MIPYLVAITYNRRHYKTVSILCGCGKVKFVTFVLRFGCPLWFSRTRFYGQCFNFISFNNSWQENDFCPVKSLFAPVVVNWKYFGPWALLSWLYLFPVDNWRTILSCYFCFRSMRVVITNDVSICGQGGETFSSLNMSPLDSCSSFLSFMEWSSEGRYVSGRRGHCTSLWSTRPGISSLTSFRNQIAKCQLEQNRTSECLLNETFSCTNCLVMTVRRTCPTKNNHQCPLLRVHFTSPLPPC